MNIYRKEIAQQLFIDSEEWLQTESFRNSESIKGLTIIFNSIFKKLEPF